MPKVQLNLEEGRDSTLKPPIGSGLDLGEMLDDPRVMHGEASGDIITTAAQRRHEVSPKTPI